MHKKTILMLGGFIGLAFSGITGAADMHTEVIASTCMSCHGPGGKSQGKIPSLTGLHKDHFVKVMTEFKAGTRASSVMKRLANGYTEAEIEAMGDYFASLK
ncbi:MAG: sulfide dehydrogenase [Thiobacillus sp. 63-78]|uniref:c-type cytochrome n=1 Tax=Thiobacillus sp. 63-78 TaxID=1895859 RepID=UPI00086F1C05|nr:c-type cytochrome [Thiobacillus sp. 63-78]MBN8763901.1 c-type cytochrome [Thiobacillus sp.]ODV11811.1 MAG: sulfide dehydrogenase [Thiobacillus sp. SCN 64-317]MBN8766484.1 c-type cytochrome [Thiobacillus sp.]MBN8772937.1 c-type cytochrome [Thiobacillus sp.]OJZ05886.1 MAG: sulfide dehydrogenase [Thiobacillus sp. 63-78]